MGRKKSTFEEFNNAAIQEGVTYAEAQMRETKGKIGRIRAPRTEDGETVYMKVSARRTQDILGRSKEEVNDGKIQT